MNTALKNYAKTIKNEGWKAGESLIKKGIKEFGADFKKWAYAIGVALRAKELLDEDKRKPVYALLVAPQADRKAILLGRQTLSIREGIRDYQADSQLMLCCHLEPWVVMADIVNVRHCRLHQVTEKEYRAAGFDSITEVVEVLRNYYPNFGMNAEVTLISWANVRGKLVDDLKAKKKKTCCGHMD